VPARSRMSRISTTTAAALVALTLSVPATALAVPAPDDCACGGAANASSGVTPRPLTNSVDSGFQLDDAAIGAGGMLVVVLTGFSVAAIARRRHAPDPPLPA
jgi:hypothetical protein